jgi:hypothetical protein
VAKKKSCTRGFAACAGFFFHHLCRNSHVPKFAHTGMLYSIQFNSIQFIQYLFRYLVLFMQIPFAEASGEVFPKRGRKATKTLVN